MAQSFRKRALEEWRGLPEPEEKMDRTLSIREVLVQLAPKLGLGMRRVEAPLRTIRASSVSPACRA